MDDQNPMVQLSVQDGVIEIRYFDNPKHECCRSWKLPEAIANDLIAWWAILKKNKGPAFPLQKRTKICEFTMHTEKFIEIKSVDCRGRTNMTGWNLPAVVVDHLSKRQANSNS